MPDSWGLSWPNGGFFGEPRQLDPSKSSSQDHKPLSIRCNEFIGCTNILCYSKMCWSWFLAQIRSKIPDIKMKLNVFLFLSFCLGLSAPSANNPFQSETPKLTLNQLGSASLATQPTSLPYSASLPLPMSHQPASLPSSLTHPTQPRLDLPGPLPEPLLPLSSVSNDGSQAVLNNQNPFLWGPMQLEKLKRGMLAGYVFQNITLNAELQPQGLVWKTYS